MSNKGNGFQVAPHGILCIAALCILIMIGAHVLGFRAMGAVKFGNGG